MPALMEAGHGGNNAKISDQSETFALLDNLIELPGAQCV
jgi:hypothetical protein